jgi:spermidine synthase
MKEQFRWVLIVGLVLVCAHRGAGQDTVFETTSPYHHIRVADHGRMRVLHFNNTTQSQISLDDPLQGHFEYTEYFHMPWLWNDQIKSVLMIGLGGSSIQRAYQAYWPEVETETVELDPKVVAVARDYFQFQETEKMRAIISDGRMHLRRTSKKYDLIILDAYTANRYGSFIPYTLVTKEFFALAHSHLSAKGVLAYNVIGSAYQRQKNIVGAIYKTLKTSFAQVYMFPALGSRNVVFLATKSSELATQSQLEERLTQLIKAKQVTFPNFDTRLKRFLPGPPPSAAKSRVLTDDFAPVDGLLRTE